MIRRRKHIHTERTRDLAASALTKKVGYLRIEDFPGSTVFATLPRQDFEAGQQISCHGRLCLIIRGWVEVRRARDQHRVKELLAGAMFGDMPLLGQSMLGTAAVAGAERTIIAFMDTETAKQWVKDNPVAVLRSIGPRLAALEAEYYRSRFQLADSRTAALLLELAADGVVVKGLSHRNLGEQLGIYRETVTNILDALKSDKIIKVERKRITILDKTALRALSEL